MSSMSKASQTIQRLRSQISNYKEEFEAVGGRALDGGLTVLGGAAVGLGINKFGDDGRWLMPGTEIDMGLAVGGLGLITGIAGMAGQYSDQLVALSSGIIAGQLAINSYKDGTLL